MNATPTVAVVVSELPTATPTTQAIKKTIAKKKCGEMVKKPT